MILCSCKNLNDTFIKAVITEHADAIRTETTDNRAAAIVWRATHPASKDGTHHKIHCGSCIGHIRDAIREMGLRPNENITPAPACDQTNFCGPKTTPACPPCLST